MHAPNTRAQTGKNKNLIFNCKFSPFISSFMFLFQKCYNVFSLICISFCVSRFCMYHYFLCTKTLKSNKKKKKDPFIKITPCMDKFQRKHNQHVLLYISLYFSFFCLYIPCMYDIKCTNTSFVPEGGRIGCLSLGREECNFHE